MGPLRRCQAFGRVRSIWGDLGAASWRSGERTRWTAGWRQPRL